METGIYASDYACVISLALARSQMHLHRLIQRTPGHFNNYHYEIAYTVTLMLVVDWFSINSALTELPYWYITLTDFDLDRLCLRDFL